MGITIDKHVSVGHIFTTVAAIIAGVSAYATMQNRIYNLEQADIRLERDIRDHKSEYKASLDRIYVMLDKINDKLDDKVNK